ncbi:hypothetical protein HZB90_01135, partial [archaeon]|nr:hypothetical protein [archaeon]
MALSILGCQGYKAPTYKTPAEGEEAQEEVDIYVSDLGDGEEVPAEEEAPVVKTKTPDVQPAATV